MRCLSKVEMAAATVTALIYHTKTIGSALTNRQSFIDLIYMYQSVGPNKIDLTHQLLFRGEHLEAPEALELEVGAVLAVVVQREVGVTLEPRVALPALDHLGKEKEIFRCNSGYRLRDSASTPYQLYRIVHTSRDFRLTFPIGDDILLTTTQKFPSLNTICKTSPPTGCVTLSKCRFGSHSLTTRSSMTASEWSRKCASICFSDENSSSHVEHCRHHVQ